MTTTATKQPRAQSLQKWCEKFGHGARAHLAREVGVRWATIHDIVEGRSKPTVKNAKLIEKATDGRVRWTSLVS